MSSQLPPPPSPDRQYPDASSGAFPFQEGSPEANPQPGVQSGLSIRLRLILAFMLIIFVPLFIIGVVQTVSNTLGERQRVQRELNVALNYKIEAISDWHAQLSSSLANLLIGDQVLNNITTARQASDSATGSTATDANLQQILDANLSNPASAAGDLFNSLAFYTPQGVILAASGVPTPALPAVEFSRQPGAATPQGDTYISSPVYDPVTQLTVVNIALPIFDAQDNLLAILTAVASTDPLYSILYNNSGLGDGGESYLITPQSVVLAGLSNADRGRQLNNPGMRSAITSKSTIAGQFTNLRGVSVIGVYRWVPELQSLIVAERDLTAINRATAAVLAVNISLAISALIIAVVISLLVTRTIALPVAELAETAARISLGELDLIVPIQNTSTTGDNAPGEITALAYAFNRMTAQLRSLITSLETRVAERTRSLEERTNYLEASTQVGRAIASILEPDQLLTRSVELIRQRFDLYYTGLFIADQTRQWAILRAGTGSAGQTMLARGHRLPLDQHSMIGWAITNAQARIALQAAEDAVRLAAPELPETRSEAAIPLRSRGQVIGALTVQSARPNAFNDETIAVLQTLADQLATAIDNTQLFSASQQALEAERRAYGQLTQSSWAAFINSRPTLAYRSTQSGISEPTNLWLPEMEHVLRSGQPLTTGQYAASQLSDTPSAAGQSASTAGSDPTHALTIPLTVRGAIIGVLHTHKPASQGGWTPEETLLIEAITEQLAIALESARLYTQTQRRAEEERLISQTTSRMRESLEIQSVITTAINEIYNALGLEEMSLWLTPPESAQPLPASVSAMEGPGAPASQPEKNQ